MWLRRSRTCLQCGRSGFQPCVWKILLEKALATHSSIAWRIPWTEEHGGLQSMGSQRTRLRATNTFTFSFRCPASRVQREDLRQSRGREKKVAFKRQFQVPRYQVLYFCFKQDLLFQTPSVGLQRVLRKDLSNHRGSPRQPHCTWRRRGDQRRRHCPRSRQSGS